LASLLALLTTLAGLLARLLLAAALLLSRLTGLRIVLLLLVAVGSLVLLRHTLILEVSPPDSASVRLGTSVPEARGGSFGGAIAADAWRWNCRLHSIQTRDQTCL
jgi:hypothetical protein